MQHLATGRPGGGGGTGLTFVEILSRNQHPDAAFDVGGDNYLFDLLPVGDFPAVLAEFRRVLKPGGRLAMVNMTKGGRWYDGFWEWVYRVRPGWLGGCRGVRLVPFLEAAGFTVASRQLVSEFGFASEVALAIKP